MSTERLHKTKSKRNERRIFRYTFADAWNDMISQVEILNGIENKNLRCLYFDKSHNLLHGGNTNVDFFSTTISHRDIDAIKHAMQSRIEIFEYKEIEFPMIIDGVINTFEFMLNENLTNTITAYNIWAFRENVGVGIKGSWPYKGTIVLELFDEISKILLDNGVDSKYIQIN